MQQPLCVLDAAQALTVENGTVTVCLLRFSGYLHLALHCGRPVLPYNWPCTTAEKHTSVSSDCSSNISTSLAIYNNNNNSSSHALKQQQCHSKITTTIRRSGAALGPVSRIASSIRNSSNGQCCTKTHRRRVR
eukprot:scpid76916/ scgid19225/ 